MDKQRYMAGWEDRSLYSTTNEPNSGEISTVQLTKIKWNVYVPLCFEVLSKVRSSHQHFVFIRCFSKCATHTMDKVTLITPCEGVNRILHNILLGLFNDALETNICESWNGIDFEV